jgi:hypothetical protein
MSFKKKNFFARAKIFLEIFFFARANVLLEHAREKFLLIFCQMLLQIDILDLKFVFLEYFKCKIKFFSLIDLTLLYRFWTLLNRISTPMDIET